MMMGPMKKKMITVGVFSFLIPTILAVVLFGMYSSNKQKEIQNLQTETAVVQRYVFSGDLPVNHIIGSNDIKMVGVKDVSAPLDSYGTEAGSGIYEILGSPIGRKLRIPVFDKTIVAESMFYTEDDYVARDDRKKEFNMISLPSDLVEGDYIDIRMLCPTGEDFLVVAAKEVLQLGVNAETNTVFLELNEDELVRLSAAIIESYVEDSIHLYAVKYSNSVQQLFEEVEVDYVEKYQFGLETLISGDYELALAEAMQNRVPMINESGEYILDENGEMQYEEFDPNSVPKKTAADYTAEQIAAQAGISVEYAERIKLAFEQSDEKLLTYFSNQTVVVSEPLVNNYPIKEEIYALIQRNPNILDTVKQKYNVEALMIERENLVNTDVYKEDIYTGEISEDSGVLSAVATKVEEEIETKKTERKEFLQNMIRNSIAEY